MCGIIIIKKNVNNLLILCEENQKKPHFTPHISIPGVKNTVNTVNMSKIPLYFHSRHGFSIPKEAKLKDVC